MAANAQRDDHEPDAPIDHTDPGSQQDHGFERGPVLIAAAPRLVGRALAAGLRSRIGMQVTILTADPGDALNRCGALRPDLALIAAPDDDEAILLARAITQRHPRTATMLLAHDANARLLNGAHQAGVSLVLPLAADLNELSAWVAVLAESAQPQPLAIWLQLAAAHTRTALLPETYALPLAAQQRRLLGLMARGLTNAGIARELGLSEKTVRNHVSRLLGKLGARTRTEAVLMAVASHQLSIPASQPPAPLDAHRRALPPRGGPQASGSESQAS